MKVVGVALNSNLRVVFVHNLNDIVLEMLDLTSGRLLSQVNLQTSSNNWQVSVAKKIDYNKQRINLLCRPETKSTLLVLSEIDQQKDESNLFLPDHSPKVHQSVVHRSLRKNE
jgi:hypothetical protein